MASSVPFLGTLADFLAKAGLDWLKTLEGRRTAAAWIRQELVQNATRLRGALLDGWVGEELSRNRFDVLGISFVRQKGETAQLLQSLEDVYQFVTPGVNRRLAGGIRATAEAQKFNALAVQINKAVRQIDEWLGGSPDAGGARTELYLEWPELMRRAGASAISFQEAWSTFSAAMAEGTAALISLTVEERIELADNPLRENESFERWHQQYSQGFAITVADFIYELRIDERKRLLFTFEPGPVTVLSALELGAFLPPGWIPAGDIAQAVRRRASWQLLYR